MTRTFTEETVIARIKSRAGFRYQSAQLAAYFGVPTARMTEVLKKLGALGKIRIARCGGNPTMYYLPTEAELRSEAKIATYHQSPVIITKGESANTRVRRELGFELKEKA